MLKIAKNLFIISGLLVSSTLMNGCSSTTDKAKPSQVAQKFCEAMKANNLDSAVSYATEYTRTAMLTLKDVPRDQLALPKNCIPIKEEIFGVNKDTAKVYFEGDNGKSEELNMVYNFKQETWLVASKK